MYHILVGSTGFVGSNLLAGHTFQATHHSTDIEGAYGVQPDLLVYAGVRAQKYLANSQPLSDQEHILDALENIRKIKPRHVVLISTVDVYLEPWCVDEYSPTPTDGLCSYGRHRLWLEERVREEFPDHLIVRLPALYGRNLKKNFLYDLIHRVPAMLSAALYQRMAASDELIRDAYAPQSNGFCQLRPLNGVEVLKLQDRFEHVGFSALNFTDSRSIYQFFPLERLWSFIDLALKEHVRLVNITSEPVTAAEIYRAVEGGDFVNLLPGEPPRYDMRSIYAMRWGGTDGYFLDRALVLDEIRSFVRGAM